MSIYNGIYNFIDYSKFEIVRRQDENISEFEDLYIRDADGAYILYYVDDSSGDLQNVARFRRILNPEEKEQETKNIKLSDLVVFKKYVPNLDTDGYGDFVIIGPNQKKGYWKPEIEILDIVNC